MENSVTEDFLDVDKAIPGQNYVCMSFVSPEKIIKRKENYIFYKFLKEKFNFEDSFEKLEEQLQDYQTDNNTEINEEFNKVENFRTNVRGVKIRGTYDTHKEASIRAKVLQKSDPSFHVFVGQVGYWLPWEPNVDEISDQQYQEEHLNNLVSRYKENELERDNYYAQETEERKKKCLEDNLKTSNTAEEASENLDNLIENLDKEESHANLKEEYQKYQDKIESSGPKNEKSD